MNRCRQQDVVERLRTSGVVSIVELELHRTGVIDESHGSGAVVGWVDNMNLTKSREVASTLRTTDELV